MSQTYKITDVKKRNTWKSSRGDEMQTYALALEGVSEPVQMNKKLPVKVEPKVGDEVIGTLEEQERNGSVYYKLTIDFNAMKQQTGGYKGQPRDDAAIKAQWAVGQSVQIGMTNNSLTMPEIEARAIELFHMTERVKAS
jgi:hypothetical protein